MKRFQRCSLAGLLLLGMGTSLKAHADGWTGSGVAIDSVVSNCPSGEETHLTVGAGSIDLVVLESAVNCTVTATFHQQFTYSGPLPAPALVIVPNGHIKAQVPKLVGSATSTATAPSDSGATLTDTIQAGNPAKRSFDEDSINANPQWQQYQASNTLQTFSCVVQAANAGTYVYAFVGLAYN